MRKYFGILIFLVFAILSCSDQPFVVGVDSPLRVVYISPTDSALNVSRDVTVKIVFSEEVAESTLSENVVLYDYSKKDESIKVETDLTYSKETNTVSLKPKKSLNFATQYLIRVKSGLTKVDTKDSKGGKLSREISAVFTTEYIDDLKVISVYPANGATGVSPDASIVVTFSEAIDNTPPSFDQTSSFVVCDTGTADSYKDGKCNTPIAGNWTFDEKKLVATFRPEVSFGYTRSVKLILSTAIRSQRAKDFGDKVGSTYYGHLKADYTVDFMTKLLDRFDVLSVSPANGSNGVGLDSQIVIKFSEAANPESVIFYNKKGDETSLKDTATLFVEDITDNKNVTSYFVKGEWDSSNRILTLTNIDPEDGETKRDFPYSRNIRITLSPKIQSVRGKALVNPPDGLKASQGFLNNGESDFVSAFSTIDPPELLIVNKIPDSGTKNVSIRSDVRITFSDAVNIATLVYPQSIDSKDYTFRMTDITDIDNPVLVEPSDSANPFRINSQTPNTVIFVPKYPLDYLHTYQIEIKEGIASERATDKSGFLKIPLVYNFTTEGVEKFFITSVNPEDGSENNGIYSKTRVRFNRSFRTDSLKTLVSGGNVTEVSGRSITDNNGSFLPESLKGYIVRFSGNNLSCSGFIVNNTDKSFELSENPSCGVDNTFTYEIIKPALLLSNSSSYIEPVSTDEPLFYYKSYLASGFVSSSASQTVTDSQKSFGADELKGKVLRFVRGKLAGENYPIESNTADTITISGQFPDLPDTTSEYIIVESSEIMKSLITSSDRRSVRIEGSDFGIDELKGLELYVLDGTGKGQVRGIIANDKDTVFVDEDFETALDSTSQIAVRDAREFIFVPKNTLAYNSLINGKVTDTVRGSISDSLNNKTEELNFSFGIIKAPELVIKSVSPSDKADNIDTEVTIKVFFSESVDPASVKKESGNILLLDSSANPVDFTILPVGTETDNIEIIPVRTALNQPRLKYSEQYSLTLKSQITSVRGGALGRDYSFTFKTIDPPPLAVLYSEPSNAEGKITTGIKRETQQNSGIPTSFVIAFSEGLKQANIDATSLILENVSNLANPFDISQAGTPILYSTQFNSSDTPPDGSLGRGEDNILTITPSDLIDYSAVVRIVIKGQDDPQGTDCASVSTCRTSGIFTSDRATYEGGQLRNTKVIVFRMEDPEPLRIIQVASEKGNQYLRRNLSGSTESVLVRFTEGVKQSSFSLNKTVFLEDVTGVADPVNGNALAAIPASVSFLDNQGNIASDDPTTTDLIGKDSVAKISPSSLLGYATVVRLRIKGDNPPSFSGVYSDRATIINGQLPRCTPQSGYNCNNQGEYVYLFSVESIKDLYVKSVTPGDGSTGIPQDAKDISIVFSEPLDCTSVSSGSVRVEQVYPSLSTISGVLNCNSDIVTFTANQGFGYSKDIRVTISTGVRSYEAQFVNPAADPLMGHIRTSFVSTFSTEDPPAPYIVSMNPGPISTNVARDSEVIVTFNEALNPSSVNTANFSITDLSSMSIITCATLELINSNTTIRCVPASFFAYSHSIAVSIRGGATGIRSAIATERGGWFNPVPNPYTYTFSIIDIPVLTVLATNFSGTENFAPNANLQIIFSSYVNFTDVVGNPADIADDKIILVKQSDINTRIPVTITNPVAGSAGSPSTIRITPTASLDYSTQYSVFVFGGYPSGVCRPERDGTNNGGCIVDEVISGTPYNGLRFDFAVASAPGLMVESVVPQDEATGIDRKPEIRITFNNPIQFGTVSGNICLTKGDNQSTNCSGPLAIPLDPFTQIDSRTVSTYPSGELDFDTTYTIVVTKGVIDIYGDSLDSYYTSVFTTITSTLVQDITVWDGTQYSNYMFYDINDAYFRIRFTKDMDTTTLNNGTIYLTYRDEFGRIVPLRGNLVWEVAPNDKRILYFTPDIYNISVCDGGEIYGWGNDGKVSNTAPDQFTSSSYNFDATFIGKKLYISGSVNGYNGYYNITNVSSGALVLENASFTIAESGLEFRIFSPSSSIPYNTPVFIHLTTNIVSADHTENISPSSGDSELIKEFRSGSDARLNSIVYSNSIMRGTNEYFFVYDTNLFDAKDVPVTSKFKARFSEALDPSSVDYRSVILSDLRGEDGSVTAGSNIFKITTSSFKSSDVGKYIWIMLRDKIDGPYEITAFIDANNVRLDDSFATSLDNLPFIKGLNATAAGVITLADSNKTIVFDSSKLGTLEYSRDYSLILMGKTSRSYANIVKAANGNYIKGIISAGFTTSQETTVEFNPVDYTTTSEINDPMLFVAMFSRPIDISTVDEESFYVIQVGQKLPALFAHYPEFPNIVTMIPIPAFRTGTTADFTVNQNVRDYRGNPLGKVWTSSLTVASAPGGAALTLENPNSVTPSSGSVVSPDLKVSLKWASAGGNFRDLLLPTSFNNYSIKLRNNADSTYVSVTTQLIPGGSSGDTIIIKPVSNLRGGTSYTLTVDLTKCANLYRLPGGATLTYTYTVENNPPQVLAAGPTGSGNSALSKIWIAFNEQIDIASVSTSTVILQNLDTMNTISGRYSQKYDNTTSRWVVYFEPSVPLRNSLAGYRVTVKSGNSGVKDLGGTPLAADYTYTFGVDNIAPQVISVNPPNGTSNVSVSSGISVTFNEAISPSSVFGATESSNGSVNIIYNSACGTNKQSYACIRLSTNMSVINIIPAEPYRLVGNRNYSVDLNETVISDLAGNVMNFLDLPPVSTFSTVNDLPVLDCEMAPAAPNNPIMLFFNETVDYSAVNSVIVYRIDTGSAIAVDLMGVSNPSGYVVTVFPQAGNWTSGDYGYIVTRNIKDLNGNQLIREYNGYFTIP